MQFKNKGKWLRQIQESLKHDRNEADHVQLNLFKDKIAEQTVQDYKQFILNYPNKLSDYLNKAYSSIVKNMPATEVQKKAKVCRIADFRTTKSNDGLVIGCNCSLGNDLHSLSLDKAIDSANKASVNKYKGKQFAEIAKNGSVLTVKVNKPILDEITKAINK